MGNKIATIIKGGKRYDIPAEALAKYGTSEGAIKGWEGRKKGDTGEAKEVAKPGVRGDPLWDRKEEPAVKEERKTETAPEGIASLSAKEMKGETPKQAVDRNAIREVARAYNESTRNLDFKGTPSNAKTFTESAKKVGDYNDFNPEMANRVARHFGEEATYTLGRESSPVVYVKGDSVPPQLDNSLASELADKFRADEVSIIGQDSYHKDHIGEMRIWWD